MEFDLMKSIGPGYVSREVTADIGAKEFTRNELHPYYHSWFAQ